MSESDFIEVGSVIPLQDGWFLDRETRVKFRFDEEGHAVDEKGELLLPMFEQEYEGDDA